MPFSAIFFFFSVLFLYSALSLYSHMDSLCFTFPMPAGLFECFHNPVNSDIDHRIINIYVIFLHVYVHTEDISSTLYIFYFLS